jgi:hypothetical protein
MTSVRLLIEDILTLVFVYLFQSLSNNVLIIEIGDKSLKQSSALIHSLIPYTCEVTL